jgi:hypothetical protein
LHYIELGNEEVIAGDDSAGYRHYTDQFNRLYDAIHARNPEIRVICSAWWRPQSPNMFSVFKAIDGRADYWDLHTEGDNALSGIVVDQTLTTMQERFLQWNPDTKMKCTIFEENGGRHDLQRALGHASTLNAVRRHGDFVLTSCAANALQPFRQNDNGWDQGQIFFTPGQVWGMPPFYAQQMAASARQPLRIFSKTTGDLDITATRNEQGDTLVIHVVNASGNPDTSTIRLDGFPEPVGRVKEKSIEGDLQAENTAENPQAIRTRESVMPFSGNTLTYIFAPHSYTILLFEKGKISTP